MNKFSYVFIFAIGVACGYIATYATIKKKYENLADEEIESVKEAYKKQKETETANISDDPYIITEKQAEEVRKIEKEKKEIIKQEYEKHVERYDYSSYFKSEHPLPSENKKGSYVISPDEFGNEESYDKINLTYYADGVVADEEDEEVRTDNGIITLEILETFGEYEDDAVHVKNDDIHAYYEILRDDRKYEDIFPGRLNPDYRYE